MSDSDDAPLLSRQELVAQQDRGLDDLAAIIRRQREIGIVIGNEVDEQNGELYSVIAVFNSILSEIIEDMTDLTEGTRTRMDRQTADVARLGNEKGTCYLWGVVIALFLVIIVLISLP